MPAALPFLSGLISATLGTGVLGVGLQGLIAWGGILGSTALGGILINVGISAGLSYLANTLFRPDAPKPEDQQTSVRNPTASRTRHYGRVKISGPWVFCETKSGNLYKVIALGTGELDAIEEYWIDDNLVELDSAGRVTTTPYINKSVIETRLGISSETHYSSLEAVFSEWDADHLGNGVSSLYALQKALPQNQLFEVFPNLTNTLYRVVARASKVYNPDDDVTEWSDNAALIIRDYLIHPDGMRLPASRVNTAQATAGWIAAYERCAEAVDLKAGGTEDRYRIWGSYAFNERPSSVISRMLQACDGRLIMTSDGGITLHVGDWSEPGVTLDHEAIVGVQRLRRGRNIKETANTIKATFLSPENDYQLTDADPWIDDDDVSARGEIVSETSFQMAPSHSQCRRLMKLFSYRVNPEWQFTLHCNPMGLAAFGERLVRVQMTFGSTSIDVVCEIQSFLFDVSEDGILQGCYIDLISMPEAAYTWDEDTEEGEAPVSETTTVDNTVPVPENLSLFFNTSTFALEASVDAAPSSALTVEYQYKATAASEWLSAFPSNPSSGDTTASIYGLIDGTEYEVQARFVTIGGRYGAWTSSATITITYSSSAPPDVTLVSATGGAGQTTIEWTSPNSALYYRTVITRNTTNDEGTATAISGSPVFGAANQTLSIIDSSLSAGTYYYWLYAQNSSGVDDGTGVATGALVVT